MIRLQKFAAALLATGLMTATAPAFAGLEDIKFGLESLSGDYLAGRLAGKERDMDVAAKYFNRALSDDPDNPVLIERTFVLDLSAGNIPEAEEFAARVLTFNSQHRMARLTLGLRDARAGDYKQAREHFKKAAYTPVGELTAALLTAWTYAGDRQLTQALAALDKLDSNDSFANFKSFHGALIADYLDQPLRAEPLYKKSYEQAGTSLRVVQAYGNFLERRGKPEEARKVYQRFLASSERNPLVLSALNSLTAGHSPKPFVGTVNQGMSEAMFSLASALTDDQGMEVALIYAQLALSLNGDFDVAKTLLGDIYEDMSQYEKAIAAYDSVPPGSILRTNAQIEIAVSRQRMEKPAEAKSQLKTVLEADPRNYEAWITLGNVYRNNEEFKDAADAYSRALDLVPVLTRDNWTALYYRGISYERTKVWDKAEADFRKALSLEPDQPMVLNYLGYSLIEKKLNLKEAMGMVRKAVDLKPNDGYIVDSLGWAHYQIGEYEEAVKNLERAVELKPADPTIAGHLGDAYWRVGRRLEARFQWQHAKDNKPEPEQLVEIEKRLANGLPDDPPVKPAENKAASDNNG
jgi:tetratricopeptide (TPR) repeat protein